MPPWIAHRFMFQLSCVQLKSRWDLRGSLHCLGLDLCFSVIRIGINLTLSLVVRLSLSCSPPVCEACLSFLGWALVCDQLSPHSPICHVF